MNWIIGGNSMKHTIQPTAVVWPGLMFCCRMDQEFYRRHSMTELKDETGSSKTLSAAARRSFFRRKQKHKRSSSKDGKDVVALDAISTDSIPFLDGETLQYPIMQCIDEISILMRLILTLFFWDVARFCESGLSESAEDWLHVSQTGADPRPAGGSG